MFFQGTNFVVFKNEEEFNKLVEFSTILEIPGGFTERPHYKLCANFINKPVSYPAFFKRQGNYYKQCSKQIIINSYLEQLDATNKIIEQLKDL